MEFIHRCPHFYGPWPNLELGLLLALSDMSRTFDADFRVYKVITTNRSQCSSPIRGKYPYYCRIVLIYKPSYPMLVSKSCRYQQLPKFLLGQNGHLTYESITKEESICAGDMLWAS